MNELLSEASLIHNISTDTGSLTDLFVAVAKPAQYIGGEWNAIRNDPSKVKARIGLAFPDVYEVGMSHLGLKVLYSIVNGREDLAAERLFAPWPDMEELMRKHRIPLHTLESSTPAVELDILGFSLQYELCATTILQMLDLAGIPLHSKDRGPSHPFVVGGGPGAFNPVPLAPFFDAFAIGDGEELILELADLLLEWKRSRSPREDLLRAWKQLPGMFIPSLHENGEKVSKRIVRDLDSADFPTRLVVPFCETVHDRVGIEIARGCTRGCRFCQAGMLYRPVREREASTIVDLAAKSLAVTGWEEVALLSLSSGDYSCIGDLVSIVAEKLCSDMVALSLPSLRTETLNERIAQQIRRVRKTGFTLAPEAGTDRLRQVINKGNTEDDLERAVRAAFEAGWRSLKLYFMIGLPTEVDEDLDGIIRLVRKTAHWARGGRITASISTFVPKAHTPFQWAGQISMEETKRRQAYIRRYFRQGKAQVKFHDCRTSFLEGVLARGDSRLSHVIKRVFEKGARLESWDDRLKIHTWMETFQEVGIDPQSYLRPRELSEELPWSFVDTGIDSDFLAKEWRNAYAGRTTDDCRFGECQDCGVCDFNEIYPKIAKPIAPDLVDTGFGSVNLSGGIRRFRLRFEKTGQMRFLGHHDIVRTFHRAFRRCGLKLDYSKGFHPQPRMRFSPPVPVGVESIAEYLDFDLIGIGNSPDEILRTLSDKVPNGLKPLELNEISLNNGAISGKIRQVTYKVTAFSLLSPEELERKVREFQSSTILTVIRERKGKKKSWNLKDWVDGLEYSGGDMTFSLKVEPTGSVNPIMVTAELLGLRDDEAKALKIVKTAAVLDTDL